jgi:hypothetical protein
LLALALTSKKRAQTVANTNDIRRLNTHSLTLLTGFIGTSPELPGDNSALQNVLREGATGGNGKLIRTDLLSGYYRDDKMGAPSSVIHTIPAGV